MADSTGRRKSEKDAEVATASAELGTGTTQSPGVNPAVGSDSRLLPFAKPYNDYFDCVLEAYRTLVQSANDIYGVYVKAAQAAIENRDAEALRVAAQTFYTAWAELGKPMAASMGRAFDTYHQEIRSAFASGASTVLGPGCLTIAARSIATVAWHRTFYSRV